VFFFFFLQRKKSCSLCFGYEPEIDSVKKEHVSSYIQDSCKTVDMFGTSTGEPMQDVQWR